MFPKTPTSIYQSPKCFVTHGLMGHIEPGLTPWKSKPWANLEQLGFIHKVDLLLPQEKSESLRQKLTNNRPSPCYYKLVMSLEQVLEREFLDECIKRGNVLMLSGENANSDPTFTIKEGTLTMYLDKGLYEKAGLAGQPQGAKGNRGLRPRWVVKYNLRSPSMLHGKKGFDRLVYAAKKVLNKPSTWLFCNVDETTSMPASLEKHFPAKFTASPSVFEGLEVRSVPLEIPSQARAEANRARFEMEANELYEWLSLIRLESPRIEVGHQVDSYLSRYDLPQAPASTTKLDKVSWQGFISPRWLRETLASVFTESSSKIWFALSASQFFRKDSTVGNEVLLLKSSKSAGEYIMWEIKSHE